MNNNDLNNQQVIACIDGASLTESVCDYASWIAQKVDVSLKLLHTINHHHESADKTNLSGNIGLGAQEHLMEEITHLEQEQGKLKMQQGKMMLQAAKERVQKNGLNDPICVQRHGDLIEALVDLEDDIRILVLGLRGQTHENQSNQVGGKLEAVIRSLHRPTLIVNEAFAEPKRLMIAYDGSEAADKAVDMVAERALYKGLDCHLVCVNKNQDTAEKLLEQATKRLQATDNVKVTIAKLTGKADLELCAYQQQHDIDLTVMGAFSHTRLHDKLLGSFTHKMLVSSNKPLLLLR